MARSVLASVVIASALLAWVALASAPVHSGAGVEVIATGVPRPLQVVLDGRSLVVLSPGWRGDAAAEIYRVDLDGELPVDLSRQPSVRIPFVGTRPTTLGTMALHPLTGELFLGEENGTRLYRLSRDEKLTLYATGLHRLAGGGSLAFDRQGRLALIDYADPTLTDSEQRGPPELEQFRHEDYRGPLVLRLAVDQPMPQPRRLEVHPPLFPRAWGGRAGGASLPRLIAVAPVGADELVVLTSGGELFRIGADAALRPFTHLPRGQYNRIHMVADAAGTLYVSAGFHIGRIFRVSPAGAVAVVAANLADPEGIAVDSRGDLLVAESVLHRLVRVRAE